MRVIITQHYEVMGKGTDDKVAAPIMVAGASQLQVHRGSYGGNLAVQIEELYRAPPGPCGDL